MTTADTRHAVYWAPEADDPLWHAGCTWLGRDASLPAATEATPRAGAAAPWRYGFHATLKAPLRLVDRRHEAEFIAAVEALAARTPSFALPALGVAWLDDFLALRPRDEPRPDEPLRCLADACVRELDRWRGPATAAESSRRASAPLKSRQRLQLDRWGYPHVFDDWRFHLTLSDSLPPLPDGQRAEWRFAAEEHFEAALEQPRRVESLALFVEAGTGEPFRLVRRFPLGS